MLYRSESSFFHLFFFLILILLFGTKAKAWVLSLFIIIINLFGVEKLHEVKQNIRFPVRRLVQHHLTILYLVQEPNPAIQNTSI